MSTALAEPRTIVRSRDEYYRLTEGGPFAGRRVELIEGEVVEMPAFRNEHCISTSCTVKALEAVFAKGYWVRCQMPLDLLRLSSPEPDAAVVSGSPRDYLPTGHPTTALLVVEVSDATLAFDLGRKANLYAAAGIEDYWVVDLLHRRVHVHRRPVRDDAQPHAHRYDEVTAYKSSDRIAPLAARRGKVAVADLLP